MRRFFFFLFFSVGCICASSEVILAKTINDTVYYRDYEHRDKIGIINKNQVVEIETSSIAHREDDNYFGFNLLMDEDSQLIRVKYKDSIGYINFADLESINNDCHKILNWFSSKCLVPVSYCKTLYNLNSKYIEDTDPFILAYDNRIKYLFITDIHKEWYLNYPINYSFANDVFFQFTARPYRYNLCGFIVRCTNNTITCLIDDNFDQLQLFPNISKYLVGNKYIFKYKIDGDYLTIYDDDGTIFEGVFINKSTWEYIFYFMKNRLMLSRVEQAKFDDYLSKESFSKIIWPIHGNGNCEFLMK